MAAFNRFGNMFATPEMMERSYVMHEAPFKIAGNLYYAGNALCATHVIDTGEGLIILDVPCVSELAYLVESIYRLGFQLKDIKYIFISHAHIDHYGSVNALAYLTGAKTFMGEIDVKDMENRSKWFEQHTRLGGGHDECFEADYAVKDGEIITLGNTSVRWVLTPGHTIGCMSHFWVLINDDGEEYRVGIYGGAGFSSLSTEMMQKSGTPVFLQQAFLDSIEKVWTEPVDIMLGNHPFHNDTFEKLERRNAGESNPFLDPTEWHRYLSEIKDQFEKFLKLGPEQVAEMYQNSGILQYRPVLRDRTRKAYEK